MVRRKFVVEIDHPEGVSVAELQEYVLDAVSTWCGSYEPPSAYDDPDNLGHPLWGIGRTVKVTRWRQPR